MSQPSPAPPASAPQLNNPLAPEPATPEVRNPDELRLALLEQEYSNFVQSSFHSDGLRNQIIQFYLILVGAAATAIVGIAQLQVNTSVPNPTPPPLWPFSLIAVAIGLVGVVMLPIFVRLRRVVIECLVGTVLIKRYGERILDKAQDKLFAHALLWDSHSLPLDEHYNTASFLLILVMILLSSGMIALGYFMWLFEGLNFDAQRLNYVLAQSILRLIVLATLQVVVYRAWLWYEIRKFIRSDRLQDKWEKLEIQDPRVIPQPQLWQPLLSAGIVGAILFLAVLVVGSLTST